MRLILMLLTLICGIALGQVAPPIQPLEPLPTNLPFEPAPIAPSVPPSPTRIMPLELRMTTTEPELRAGKLLMVRQDQFFLLPIASVMVSRATKKLSSGLETALLDVARKFNQPSFEARFVRVGQLWVAKQGSAWKLNLPATRVVLLRALAQDALFAEGIVSSQAPKRTVQELYNQGIRYYFGGGQSSFAGSPSYRVQNILAATKQLDAQFLKRGAVFNFNSSIKLSAASGFVLGNIIRGNSLSKEIGGGICQVSTTVWRAAYTAGLPIIERHQHSYRVAYYDPPGFEATVFAPSKNLRFSNDTKNTLWIQLELDSINATLELHFFGVKPERQVQISEPQISRERPAPKDRFVPDETIKLGEVKIVSGAENGMQARINRTVQYNSGRIRRDSTQSRYVPWGAIYAVNPKDPRVK